MHRYISGNPTFSVSSGGGGGSVYTAGNDLALSGTTFSLKNTIDVKDITAVDISGLGLYNLSGDGILINNSGFVGINLSGVSPEYHLDVSGNVRITGNLTVSGDTIKTTTQDLMVEDKNIILGDISGSGGSYMDQNISGGGIILKGDTDKTLLWSHDKWNLSGGTLVVNNANVEASIFIGNLSGHNISGGTITANVFSGDGIASTSSDMLNTSGKLATSSAIIEYVTANAGGGGSYYSAGNDLTLCGTTFSLKNTIDVKDITAVDISGLGLYNLSGDGILINNSGFVGVNMSGASPTHNLDVSGNVRVTGNLSANVFSGDGINTTSGDVVNTSGNIATSSAIIEYILYYHELRNGIANSVYNSPFETSISNGTKTTTAYGSVHKFTIAGTFTISHQGAPYTPVLVEYLIVAGGGGGGGSFEGGGGGAGGFKTGTLLLSVGEYTIVVGTGGVGGLADGSGLNKPEKGNDSYIEKNNVTFVKAEGGGFGAQHWSATVNGSANGTETPAGNGGSGGGANHLFPDTIGFAHGSAMPMRAGRQGHNGGGGVDNNHKGAGGGGAGDPGVSVGGDRRGGYGLSSTIVDGSSVIFYAGGGGGGRRTAANNPANNGGAGQAGGGDGAAGDGGDGTNGTGGGGGGGGGVTGTSPPSSNRKGGDGGNGIVIIKI